MNTATEDIALAIKDFARNMLGCGCSEDVFDKIEYTPLARAGNDITLHGRINIGNRLLIYTVPVDDVKALFSLIPSLVLCGRNERDRNGFNRFRLVLLNQGREELPRFADSIFHSLNYIDDKTHLHIIPLESINW